MDIKKFKDSSLSSLETQALNHVFYARDIESNLSYVKKVEREKEIQFLSSSQVLSYWNKLSLQNRMNELVMKNAYLYTEFLDDFSKSFLRNALDIKSVSPMQGNMARRMYQCESIMEVLYAFFESEQVMNEKVNYALELEFWFSGEILMTDDYTDELRFRTLFSWEFLDYCNYLIRSGSPLVNETAYRRALLMLLRYNHTFRELCNVVCNVDYLDNYFFKVNRCLARYLARND